jgi:hypothetical protein
LKYSGFPRFLPLNSNRNSHQKVLFRSTDGALPQQQPRTLLTRNVEFICISKAEAHLSGLGFHAKVLVNCHRAFQRIQDFIALKKSPAIITQKCNKRRIEWIVPSSTKTISDRKSNFTLSNHHSNNSRKTDQLLFAADERRFNP